MDNTQSIFYIISIIVAVSTPIGAYIHVRTILAEMLVKVETLWDLHLRAAMQSAIHQGVATKNSPLVITFDAQEICCCLKEELQKWYATLPKPISDRDLIIAVNQKFGARIASEVSLPRKIDAGAALLIAAAVAKNDAHISLPEVVLDST